MPSRGPLVQAMSETGTVALNNYLQGLNRLYVLSWVEKSDGPSHTPRWTCTCKIQGKTRGEGTGSKKHIARDAAANAALASLKEKGFEDDKA